LLYKLRPQIVKAAFIEMLKLLLIDERPDKSSTLSVLKEGG
jgi:hypothetical protein